MTAGEPPQPGLPSPPAWPQPAAPRPDGLAGPAPTEPFAVVSLVCSIGAVAFCLVGSVLGIVFGHIARRRIRVSGGQGSGMALAGIILGYLGVAVAFLAVVGIVVLSVAFNAWVEVEDTTARARDLNVAIVDEALVRESSPRDALVIHRAVASLPCDEDDCVEVTVGNTGVPAAGAFPEELERAGWRLQVEDEETVACLTVPSEPAVSDALVWGGVC